MASLVCFARFTVHHPKWFKRFKRSNHSRSSHRAARAVRLNLSFRCVRRSPFDESNS